MGGNVDEYNKIMEAQNKTGNCSEFTYAGWQHSAGHLVAYQILDHYKHQRNGRSTVMDAEKAAEKAKRDSKSTNFENMEPHPILSEELLNIGMSYKGHKKTENLIQVLFVFGAANKIE